MSKTFRPYDPDQQAAAGGAPGVAAAGPSAYFI